MGGLGDGSGRALQVASRAVGLCQPFPTARAVQRTERVHELGQGRNHVYFTNRPGIPHPLRSRVGAGDKSQERLGTPATLSAVQTRAPRGASQRYRPPRPHPRCRSSQEPRREVVLLNALTKKHMESRTEYVIMYFMVIQIIYLFKTVILRRGPQTFPDCPVVHDPPPYSLMVISVAWGTCLGFTRVCARVHVCVRVCVNMHMLMRLSLSVGTRSQCERLSFCGSRFEGSTVTFPQCGW